MGILRDKLIGAVGDIVVGTIMTAARLIRDHLLDSKSPGVAERIAKRMTEAMLQATELEAKNLIAAEQLPGLMNELYATIKKSMDNVFTPDGSIPDIDVPMETVSAEEFDRRYGPNHVHDFTTPDARCVCGKYESEIATLIAKP